MGTLHLVATPIGNLKDISPRAVETLRSVDVIFAEDTRRTGQLLSHFDIHKPINSYYEQNEDQIIPEILDVLTSANVALVSDAGTPTISDPGFKLVRKVIEEGFNITSIPGPNAAILALTESGLPTDRFTFLGFLPKKDGAKRKVLEEVKDWRTTLILYESPFRVQETLKLMLEVLGDRPAAVSRELTKVHEQIIRGKLSNLIDQVSQLKGEVTIVVGVKIGDEGARLQPGVDRLLDS